MNNSDLGDKMRFAISARIIGVMHGESGRVKMFMTSISWSDGCEVIVYRSFLDFKNFHRQLKKRFPVENPLRKRDRRIPKFGAITMRRKMQEKGPSWSVRQMNLLENYCNELLRCDHVVARSSDVTQFFCPKNHDLQADFTKNSIMVMPLEEKGVMSGQHLSMGNVTHPFVTHSYCCVASYETKDTKNRPFKVALDERLDVLIKDPAGWWLVENENKQLAWFPAPYLEKCEEEEDEDELDGIPLGGTVYCAVRSYSTKKHDEVSVPIGSAVEVLKKSDNGWWLIRYKGRAGYIPSMYLQPSNYPCAGLHTLQRVLHSSSLSLATHINGTSLESSGGIQSGNRCPPTLYEKTGLQQQTSTQPVGNQYQASRLQKTRSLELLSETPSGRTVPASQRDEYDLSKPYPSSQSCLNVGDSSDSDFSSSGSESTDGSQRTSFSCSSEEEPQGPPHSPKSSGHPGESSSSSYSRANESLCSCSKTRSSKMPVDAPRVPPRPRVQEILTRCTTMTRKAALASRVNLFSQQDPIQSI
ncbi:NADPH oxidase organizer 1b [Esox lucius]|uniref:NADPH oxidase organizer 1b n=1 Tax=Esox lucius TaxID=8010 RepID=A0A3P8YRI4_ESOLU|nr:NADPH oxidase organizer 1b [Esox lucius]